MTQPNHELPFADDVSIVFQPERCHWWSGRRILPPDGVLALPGPRILRRHKRTVQLRVDLREYASPSLNGWYAVAEGESDTHASRLVAWSAELEPLLVYLTDRFWPCAMTITPDPSAPKAHSDDAPASEA